MHIKYKVDTTQEENEELRDRVAVVREKWGTPQVFIARQTNIGLAYFNQWINKQAPCYNFGQKAKETPRSEIACLPD